MHLKVYRNIVKHCLNQNSNYEENGKQKLPQMLRSDMSTRQNHS